MDGGNKRDFPTGSSGGGGKRGYGVKISHVYPYGDDDYHPNTGGESSGNASVSSENLNATSAVEENVEDLKNTNISEAEPDESIKSENSSSDSELQDEGAEEDDRDDDVEEINRQLNALGYDANIDCHSYLVYIPRRSAYVTISSQLPGPGSFAFNLNVNNGIGYNARYGIGNVGAYRGFQDYQDDDDAAFEDRLNGVGFRAMYLIHYSGAVNLIHTGHLLYYVITITNARLARDGFAMSDMLSLRDSHVLNIAKVTNYNSFVAKFCTHPDLFTAVISHIECVKALMARNLPLALAKQVTCVEAVMRLLYEPYVMQEQWTRKVIYTVNLDLRILSDKATASSNRGRTMMHLGWVINNFICMCDNPNCQCRQPRVYGIRRFYRRS